MSLAAGLCAAAAAFTSCSGSEQQSTPKPALSGAVRLHGDYSLLGRRHRVDAEVALGKVVDPYRSLVVPAPPNGRLVAVQLRIRNRARDAFPLRWARFHARDERGRPLPAAVYSTPVRKTVPDRPVRGQVLASLVAFQVPRGRRIGTVRMTSIVRLWPFRARWVVRR
jgi:hypothetical protein